MIKKTIYIHTDKRYKPYTYRVRLKIIDESDKITYQNLAKFKGTHAKKEAVDYKKKLDSESQLHVTETMKLLTLKDAITEYIEIVSKMRNWTTQYKKDTSRHLLEFQEYCSQLKISKLTEITVKHLDKFIAQLPDTLKTRSVNSRIVSVKALFNNLEEKGDIVKSPFRHVKKLREKDKSKTQALTDKQTADLLEAAQKTSLWLYRVLFTLIYTGMRMGELCKLEWKHIDEQLKTITLQAKNTKGGYERQIPIHPELKEVLMEIPRTDSNVFLYDNKNPVKRYHLEHKFRKLVRSLNLPIGLHSLRATFITKAFASAGDIAAIRAIVGHKDLTTTTRYIDSFEPAKIKTIAAMKFSKKLAE